MNSHEYARELQRTVDHLLERPEFETNHSEPFLFISFWEKDAYVAAARALGSGIKQFSGGDLHFKPNGTCLTLSISQDKVCRKVQEAKWECEPLFSPGEVRGFGSGRDSGSVG